MEMKRESTPLLAPPVNGFASPGLASLGLSLPALVGTDEHSQRRFLEFFTVNIRNPNTRKAYAGAVVSFFDWCSRRHLTLQSVQAIHVAVYVEDLQTRASKQTVKQHLAGIRSLFDWLVVGQVVVRSIFICNSY